MKIKCKTKKRNVQTTDGTRVNKTYIDIDNQGHISEEQILDIIKDTYKIPHYHALATLEAIHDICMNELFQGKIINIPFLGTLRLKLTRAKYEKQADSPERIPSKALSINYLPYKTLRKTLKEIDHE